MPFPSTIEFGVTLRLQDTIPKTTSLSNASAVNVQITCEECRSHRSNWMRTPCCTCVVGEIGDTFCELLAACDFSSPDEDRQPPAIPLFRSSSIALFLGMSAATPPMIF